MIFSVPGQKGKKRGEKGEKKGEEEGKKKRRRPANLFGPSFIAIYRRGVKSELNRNAHVSRAFVFLGKKKTPTNAETFIRVSWT